MMNLRIAFAALVLLASTPVAAKTGMSYPGMMCSGGATEVTTGRAYNSSTIISATVACPVPRLSPGYSSGTGLGVSGSPNGWNGLTVFAYDASQDEECSGYVSCSACLIKEDGTTFECVSPDATSGYYGIANPVNYTGLIEFTWGNNDNEHYPNQSGWESLIIKCTLPCQTGAGAKSYINNYHASMYELWDGSSSTDTGLCEVFNACEP